MLNSVTNFILTTGKSFFDSLLNDWSIIGYFIILSFLINRAVNFIKKFF